MFVEYITQSMEKEFEVGRYGENEAMFRGGDFLKMMKPRRE